MNESEIGVWSSFDPIFGICSVFCFVFVVQMIDDTDIIPSFFLKQILFFDGTMNIKQHDTQCIFVLEIDNIISGTLIYFELSTLANEIIPK